MARIRLFKRTKLLPLHDALGRMTRVDLTRHFCTMHVGSPDAYVVMDGLIDTGSPLGIIPQRNWSAPDFPIGAVRWLTPPGGSTVRVLAAGGAFQSRIGIVPVRIVSPSTGDALAWVDVVTQFTHDGLKIEYAVVGFSQGILIDRRLVIEPNAAFIEDL